MVLTGIHESALINPVQTQHRLSSQGSARLHSPAQTPGKPWTVRLDCRQWDGDTHRIWAGSLKPEYLAPEAILQPAHTQGWGCRAASKVFSFGSQAPKQAHTEAVPHRMELQWTWSFSTCRACQNNVKGQKGKVVRLIKDNVLSWIKHLTAWKIPLGWLDTCLRALLKHLLKKKKDSYCNMA